MKLLMATLLCTASPAPAPPAPPPPIVTAALSGALPVALTLGGFAGTQLLLNAFAPATTGLGHHLIGQHQRGLAFAAGGTAASWATFFAVYTWRMQTPRNLTQAMLHGAAAAGLAGSLVGGWAAWDAYQLAQPSPAPSSAP